MYELGAGMSGDKEYLLRMQAVHRQMSWRLWRSLAQKLPLSEKPEMICTEDF